MNDSTARTAPIVFPPVIPVTGFLAGVVLERLVPLGARVTGAARTVLHAASALLFVAGAAGFAWMVVTMKRARTPIHGARTPTTLVESGPFRFTRNPMYVFGSVAYAGLALALVQPWSLALLVAVVAAMHHGVVLREENLLAQRFGEAYRDDRSREPRYF